MNPIGVFGGTFDPIHYGHLRTAYEMLQALKFDEVRFMPCGEPPHRDEPRADSALRLSMVTAAIQGQKGFIIDDRGVTEYPVFSQDPCMEDCKVNVEVTMRARVLDVTPEDDGS